MNDSMQKALEAIADALHTGKEDILTVVSVIIAVILLIVAIASIVRFRSRRQVKTSSELSYQKLIRKYNLTILELDLLDEMRAVMKEPEKRYQLLVNGGTFRRAVHKLGDLPPEKLSLIASIQEKTGLASETGEADGISTRSLDRGLPLYLERQTGEVLRAEVYSISDSDVMVKLHDNRTLDAGEKLSLYLISRHGLSVYPIEVNKSKESLISVFHSDKEEKSRRNVKLDIKITKSIEGGPEEQFTTVLLQSTEAGAVLHDPEERLNPGDRLKLYATHDHKNSQYAEAVVEKISRERQLALVKYRNSEK